MIIQVFLKNPSFPEFHFGRREGKLFVELDPEDSPSVGILHKGKKMAYAVAAGSPRGPTIRRYQVIEPGIYTLKITPDDILTMKIGLRKGSSNLYDLAFETKNIVGRFVGNIRINGIKLSSLAQKEEEPSVGPTLWERLDA